MATNLVNNLFPPQVETFQPAFIYNTSPSISFSISPFNTPSDIRYLHVSLVDQRNNENALVGLLPQAKIENIDGETYFYQNEYGVGYGLINGILIIDFPQRTDQIHAGELIQYDRKNDKYVVSIPLGILRQTKTVKVEALVESNTESDEEGNPIVLQSTEDTKYFNVGQYYKVQLRFDSCDREINLAKISKNFSTIEENSAGETDSRQSNYEDFINYLIKYRQYFSEWSEVTLIKPILHVNFNFPQLDGSVLGEQNGLKNLNQGIIPLSASIVMKDKLYYIESLKSSPNLEDFKNVDGLVDETEHVERFRFTVHPMNLQGIVDYDTVNYQGKWEFTTIREDTKSAEYGINTTIELEEEDADSYYALVIEYYTNNNYYGKDIRYFECTKLEEVNPPWWHDLHDTYHRSEGMQDYVEINQEDGIVKIRLRWEIKGGEGDSAWKASDGILYLRRASSLDNFKTWKLMSITSHSESDLQDDENFVVALDFDDYTVCSLVRYRYSVQYHMLKASTNPSEKGKVIEANWTKSYLSGLVYPQFYDMLLQRQNRQIAIRYNGQISSWKPVVNRQKIDTLGGRYPKFVENAQLNYKQFSINGLISAEGDFNRTFLNEFDGEFVEHIPTKEVPYGDYILKNGKYIRTENIKEDTITYDWKYKYLQDMNTYDNKFNGKYILRNDTKADGEYGYNPNKKVNEYSLDPKRLGFEEDEWLVIDSFVASDVEGGYDNSIFTDNESGYTEYYQHDFYPMDNWFWERTFRDELVKWLNDGEPKLYRSMPEGNMAVMLTDINLTPNPQIGRRLYNFSATMYEIGDGNDLEVLDALGIYNAPKLTNKYGETNFSPSEEIDTDSDEDEAFTLGITQLGQLWLPDIYGRDLIDSAAIGKNENNTSQYIWNKMSIAQRVRARYMGAFKDYSVKGNVKLDWVRFQFISKPKYYIYNSTLSSKNRWEIVNMDPEEDPNFNKEYSYDNIINKTFPQSVKNPKEVIITGLEKTLVIKPKIMEEYNGAGKYKVWTIQFKDADQYDKLMKGESAEILTIAPNREKPPKEKPYDPPVEYRSKANITSLSAEEQFKIDFIIRYVLKVKEDKSENDNSLEILRSNLRLNNLNDYGIKVLTGTEFKNKLGNIFNAEYINDTAQYYVYYDADDYILRIHQITELATILTFIQNKDFTYSWTDIPSINITSIEAKGVKSDTGEIITINESDFNWYPSSYLFHFTNINKDYSRITLNIIYSCQETLIKSKEAKMPLILNNSTMSLGYCFDLNDTEIFVNDRGFYQTPKDTSINKIILKNLAFDNDHKDDVIIDYKVTYKRLHDTSNIPVRTTRLEKIIGQWGGTFPYGKAVREDIYKKYYYIQYALPNESGQYEWMVDFPEYYVVDNNNKFTRKNSENEITEVKVVSSGGYWILKDIEEAKDYKFESRESAAQWLWMHDVGQRQKDKLPKQYIQYLDTWQGVSVDVTPYAVLEVKYPTYQKETTLIVGRSGALSLLEDNPVSEITFKGRRMVQAPKSRQPYLDEWEYVLDDLLSIEFGLGDLTEGVNWIDWYQNAEHSTKVEVAFYFGYTVEQMEEAINNLTDSMKRYLWPYWLKTYYDSLSEIEKPQYNTVYPIANNGNTLYYIYYIDDKWYPVDPIYKDTRGTVIADMENQGTIVAEVPIYGYVNYSGEILRSYL